MIKYRRQNALFPDRCTALPILLRNELLPNYILMCWKQLLLLCVFAPSFPPVHPFTQLLRKLLSSWPVAVRVTEEEWEKPVLIIGSQSSFMSTEAGGFIATFTFVQAIIKRRIKRNCKLYLFSHSFSCNFSNNFIFVWFSHVCWTAALAVLQN